MGRHLVFYDGKCGLCDQVVQFLLKIDSQELFVFAPLQGETAASLLQDLPSNIKAADSIILIENYKEDKRQTYIFGKAAFKVLWLVGGPWRGIGWISFLPPVLYDWGYRFVARNRHRFFRYDSCIVPSKAMQSRFLP